MYTTVEPKNSTIMIMAKAHIQLVNATNAIAGLSMDFRVFLP